MPSAIALLSLTAYYSTEYTCRVGGRVGLEEEGHSDLAATCTQQGGVLLESGRMDSENPTRSTCMHL
jgi:hypothetical protein